MATRLEIKFKKHLYRTVGKRPSNKEMILVNKKISEEYAKIYDKPNKPSSIIRESYNNVLSKIWPKLVASTSSFSEIALLSKYAIIKSDYQITSIASGLCVYELFLAKEFVPQGWVCCIDLSEGMNRKARALARKLKQHNISIITASATKIPIKSNSQDVVLARRPGLSNDKRWVTVLKEVRRILKKNSSSRFIYTVAEDFNKPTKDIKDDLLKTGLKFITIKKFGVKEKYPSFMIIACVKSRELDMLNTQSHRMKNIFK